MSEASETPVLIVGGSVVGLSAAAFLAAQGIRATLVERRREPSRRLRAKVFYARTMELYRSIGLEERILAAEPSGPVASDVAIVESLAGRELQRWTVPAAHDIGNLSPSRSAFLKQRELERLLRVRAGELGADLRFSSELLWFDQGAGGVTARVRDVVTGEETSIRAFYMIAADGNASPIREALAIGREGPGTLSHQMDIGFEADLAAIVAGRPLAFAYVRRPDLNAYVAWEPTLDAGTVSVAYDPAAADVAVRFGDENCLQLVGSALGLAPSAIRLTGKRPWQMASWIAQRYRAGRVFLAGDAAHVMPPVGGFGANTGIQDAHNLAAKLGLVLRGEAGEAILESYDGERRAVGRFTVDQATLRLAGRPAMAGRIDPSRPPADETAVTLGYLYRSGTIIPDDVSDLPALDPALLDGRPGSRAPHVPLRRSGEPISSLDLYRRHMVLVAGPAGQNWRAAASEVASAAGLPIDAYLLGREILDPADRFPASHGIDGPGAILIRPDGFVAWRSPRGAVAESLVLASVLRRVLARQDAPSPAALGVRQCAAA